MSLQRLVTTFGKDITDGAGKNARSKQDDFSDLFSANQMGMRASPESMEDDFYTTFLNLGVEVASRIIGSRLR
jgi:hypothetical protein